MQQAHHTADNLVANMSPVDSATTNKSPGREFSGEILSYTVTVQLHTNHPVKSSATNMSPGQGRPQWGGGGGGGGGGEQLGHFAPGPQPERGP